MRSRKAIKLVGLSAVFMLGVLPRAEADPVVYANQSHIFGYVTVLQDGLPILTGNYFDTSITGPTSGAWSVADMRTVNELGAQATIRSSVGGTISPTHIAGTGSVSGVASAPPGTSIGAQTWGRSVSGLLFQLDQPYAFRYTADYFAESDGLFGIMAARLSPMTSQFGSDLPPVFEDDFRFFPGELVQRTTHVGFLEAGFYRLVLANDPIYVVAPDDTFKNSTFDFSFDLTPVPEPASLLLVGVGLAGVAGRRWRRGRSTSR